MQNEKFGMLQSSMELLKERIKTFDYFKTTLESRVSNLENKCSVLANHSTRQEKENISNIDHLLSQSHYFTSALKKLDNTSLNNLKRLEDHFGETLQEQQAKFLQIQERMLAMLSQKQKILRNMSLQMQNHAHSIKAIQEWIKTDHNRGNSFTIMEDSIKERLEMIQKNNQMKLLVIDEKIKYLETIQESAANNRKKIADDRQELDEEISIIKKDMMRRLSQVEQQLNDERMKRSAQLENSQKSIFVKIDKNHQKIEQLNKKIQVNHQILENKLNSEVSALKQTIQSNAIQAHQPQPQQRQQTNPSQRRQESVKNVQYYDQREILTTPLSQERVRNEFNRGKYENSYERSHGKQEYQSVIEKKPLPPKKNLFSAEVIESPPQIEKSSREMSGGIRGLLQKSKQKESSKQRPSALSRQKSSSKGLPPVREDPFAKKKKTQGTIRRREESEQEQEQVVYQIDEEGYLMDQEGNYLLNQHGEMIRLSPEEIEQYMQDGDGY